MDSGITAMSSVQIQHVASQRWFGQNPHYKLETVTTNVKPQRSKNRQPEVNQDAEEVSEDLNTPRNESGSGS